MNPLEENRLIRAFPLPALLIAVSVLLITNIAVHFFLHIRADEVEELRIQKSELEESYIQMKAFHVDSVLSHLQKQATAVDKRVDALMYPRNGTDAFSDVVSRLEKIAARHALHVATPELRYGEAVPDSSSKIRLQLQISGSFGEMMAFIRALSLEHPGLFYERFRLSAQEESDAGVTADVIFALSGSKEGTS